MSQNQGSADEKKKPEGIEKCFKPMERLKAARFITCVVTLDSVVCINFISKSDTRRNPHLSAPPLSSYVFGTLSIECALPEPEMQLIRIHPLTFSSCKMQIPWTNGQCYSPRQAGRWTHLIMGTMKNGTLVKVYWEKRHSEKWNVGHMPSCSDSLFLTQIMIARTPFWTIFPAHMLVWTITIIPKHNLKVIRSMCAINATKVWKAAMDCSILHFIFMTVYISKLKMIFKKCVSVCVLQACNTQKHLKI